MITRMANDLFEIKTLPSVLGLAANKKKQMKDRMLGSEILLRVAQFRSYQYRESFNEDEQWKNCTSIKKTQPLKSMNQRVLQTFVVE